MSTNSASWQSVKRPLRASGATASPASMSTATRARSRASAAVRPLDPNTATLPVYALEIAPEHLAALQADIESMDEVPASVRFEGRRYAAEVRFRGHVGRSYSKKSWKIIFREESPIAPRDRMNLRAQYEDASLLRGELTSLIYEDVGIRPPQSRSVLLFVNGEYAGVYNDFEQVDNQFLARTGRNPDAGVYATAWTEFGNWSDLLENADQYHAAYAKESNREFGLRRSDRLCRGRQPHQRCRHRRTVGAQAGRAALSRLLRGGCGHAKHGLHPPQRLPRSRHASRSLGDHPLGSRLHLGRRRRFRPPSGP